MKYTLYIILGLILISCSDTELEKSVFISDIDYPELPAYSEWGYNTFGAYYDRQAFVSNDYQIPVKVISTNGETSIVLTGQIGKYYMSGYTMTLSFITDEFTPLDYNDLYSLNDTIVDLSLPGWRVEITSGTTNNEVKILTGHLHVKKAQNLFVDKVKTEIILSGTFEFQALIDNIPKTVSNGRFDLGIGKNNFFAY
jgi:hypothetical protein